MQNESLTLRVTPAGKLLMRFLAMFNRGDEQVMRRFFEEYFHETLLETTTMDEFVAWYMDMYHTTGGMEVFKVYLSQEHYLIVILSDRKEGVMYMDKLKVSSEKPHKIVEYLHERAP